jgi:hypothetical protein
MRPVDPDGEAAAPSRREIRATVGIRHSLALMLYFVKRLYPLQPCRLHEGPCGNFAEE